MATFILLTRIAPAAVHSRASLKELEQALVERVSAECPRVEWLHSYATLGRFQYLDIFTAPDVDTALRVATMVRVYGQADAEIWPAQDWQVFKRSLD